MINDKNFDGISETMGRISQIQQALTSLHGVVSLSQGQTPELFFTIGYQHQRASSSENYDAEALRRKIEETDRIIRDRIENALCEAQNILKAALKDFGITFAEQPA